jgi:hypothetical protein
MTCRNFIHLTDEGNHPLETGDAFVINGDTRHGFAQKAESQLMKKS